MRFPIPLLVIASSLCLAAAATFPRGVVSALLHEQSLSHLAFHSPSLKLRLARLLSPPSAVAVVGVEWGSEVFPLAAAGFHVFAFEPASKFLAHLRDRVLRNPQWNVTILPLAAGSARQGFLDLRYDNHDVAEHVPQGIVDDYVKQPLAVLSIDIQGDELDVLKGSRTLMHSYGVASLWVEAIACNAKLPELLELLDQRYVLFDFVPWGKRNDDTSEAVPRQRESFAFDPHRPGRFESFLEWMCQEKKDRYQWLQTDFLAIRRDLLTEELRSKLEALAVEHCDGTDDNDADCHLRSLLLHASEKDEL